jgi:DNA-binding MarR family transcriptional regulator
MKPSLIASYGFLLAKASEEMENYLQTLLIEYGINARHYGILLFVNDHKHYSQKEIGEKMKIDRTTMVALIDFLEAKQLVKRIKNEQDRRFYCIELTSRGEEMVKKGWNCLMKSEMKVLQSLTTEEQDVLKKLLLKIWEGLHE